MIEYENLSGTNKPFLTGYKKLLPMLLKEVFIFSVRR